MVSSKTCFKCDKNMPFTEFYKHPRMADGHLGKCKECTKKDVFHHRNENIEKIREYDRARSKNPERAKTAAEIIKIWRKEDSRRTCCHNEVARAVRSGRLVKMACCICGSEKSLAHHESYDNPLDVIWYCQPHHKQRHKEMAIFGIETYGAPANNRRMTMNVFEIANEYRHLESIVDSDDGEINEDELLEQWLTIQGDFNQKVENIGFAIRNREAILAGKQEAIKAMEASAISVEKEIDRLKALAVNLMVATDRKKSGGNALTLSIVPNQPKVIIDCEADLPLEYLREIPAVPASTAPDKKKLADDMKIGVIVSGARLLPSVRLAIK